MSQLKHKNKVTINDIARLAQVSKTTVSFYLNKKGKISQETQARIQQVIEETGYKPSQIARSLNNKNSKLLGVIIGDITNSFSNQIVKGIETIANSNGYQIIVGNSNFEENREKNYLARMLSMGVDGFIVQPSSAFDSSALDEANKPYVFFDSKTYDEHSSWVKTNNYEATYQAVTKYLEHSFTNFIMIGAEPAFLSTRMERMAGFNDATSGKQVEVLTLMINNYDIDKEMVTQFLEKYLKKDKKNLVFVPNCWALSDVFTILKENFDERLTIELLGFDNVEWTRLTTPRIQTIVQPALQEGQEAAKILINQIEHSDQTPIQKTLECTFELKMK